MRMAKEEVKMKDKQFIWTLFIMGCMYVLGLLAKIYLELIGIIIIWLGVGLLYILICGQRTK